MHVGILNGLGSQLYVGVSFWWIFKEAKHNFDEIQFVFPSLLTKTLMLNEFIKSSLLPCGCGPSWCTLTPGISEHVASRTKRTTRPYIGTRRVLELPQ